MTDRTGKLHLNVVLRGSGHHAAAWKHPAARPLDDLSLDYYADIVRIAERGLFDAAFMADGYGISGPTRRLEPLTLLSALAALTSRIGLIGTVDTSFNDPYHVARKFASLDHLSKGRSAWNIVTSSSNASAQFNGRVYPDPAVRYEIAGEFVEAVKQLWDSWDYVQALPDKTADVPHALSKPRQIDFEGNFFTVKGPLNVQRPPQGYPVLVQAGASEAGKELAAKTGEIVFSAQQTLAAAQQFYGDVKSRLRKYGRTPDQLLVIPGFAPIVADTEAEAKELEWEFTSLARTASILSELSRYFTVDLNEYELDDPVPVDKELPADKQTTGITSRGAVIVDAARRERMTIRQLISRSAGGHGHMTVAGSAVQVADVLEQWFTNHGADGFNLMPHVFPDGLRTFVDKVVPELQNRGLYRTAYEGTTLRDSLGLQRPQNRWLGKEEGEGNEV